MSEQTARIAQWLLHKPIGIFRGKELLIFFGINEKLFHAKHAEKLAKSAESTFCELCLLNVAGPALRATGFARTILEQEDNLPAQLPQIFIENHKTEVII